MAVLLSSTTLIAQPAMNAKVNKLAGVEAQQNRQQFDTVLNDVDACMAVALANGGTLLSKVHKANSEQTGSVYDPDGNVLGLGRKNK